MPVDQAVWCRGAVASLRGSSWWCLSGVVAYEGGSSPDTAREPLLTRAKLIYDANAALSVILGDRLYRAASNRTSDEIGAPRSHATGDRAPGDMPAVVASPAHRWRHRTMTGDKQDDGVVRKGARGRRRTRETMKAYMTPDGLALLDALDAMIDARFGDRQELLDALGQKATSAGLERRKLSKQLGG